jgi:hypothetical protein
MFWFLANSLGGLTKLDLLDIPKFLLSFRIFHLVCLRLMCIKSLWKFVSTIIRLPYN